MSTHKSNQQNKLGFRIFLRCTGLLIPMHGLCLFILMGRWVFVGVAQLGACSALRTSGRLSYLQPPLPPVLHEARISQKTQRLSDVCALARAARQRGSRGDGGSSAVAQQHEACEMLVLALKTCLTIYYIYINDIIYYIIY